MGEGAWSELKWCIGGGRRRNLDSGVKGPHLPSPTNRQLFRGPTDVSSATAPPRGSSSWDPHVPCCVPSIGPGPHLPLPFLPTLRSLPGPPVGRGSVCVQGEQKGRQHRRWDPPLLPGSVFLGGGRPPLNPRSARETFGVPEPGPAPCDTRSPGRGCRALPPPIPGPIPTPALPGPDPGTRRWEGRSQTRASLIGRPLAPPAGRRGH